MTSAAFTTRPDIVGGFGVVAATPWIAAQTGMRMLEFGGNAFDAAVATAFTLQVVMPHMNGPGGDASILMATADGTTQVVCGQGCAPAAATIEHFQSLGLAMIPGSGLLAAVVPGAVGAWLAMLRDYGSLDICTVLEPAVHYARNGWPLHDDTVGFITSVAPLFQNEWSSSGQVWLRHSDPPATGSWWSNPRLADTYETLLAAAGPGGSRDQRIERVRRAFYEGFVAEAIGQFCAATEVADSSGRSHCGLLTAQDMASWQARFEPPATFDYHGVTVCKTGPWGQGPVMLQMLALLKGFDLTSLESQWRGVHPSLGRSGEAGIRGPRRLLWRS